MAGNFLEELISEWYEYQGYFVRRNVLVGKRTKGGHECELDIVAFNPEKKVLLHAEPSMDTDSWQKRELRYAKKFKAGKKYIPELFKHLDVPTQIDQIAIFVFGSKKTYQTIGGKIILLPEHLSEIFSSLKSRSIYRQMSQRINRSSEAFNL
jgi:hypothetical protein